jgi:hypothetical protein
MKAPLSADSPAKQASRSIIQGVIENLYLSSRRHLLFIEICLDCNSRGGICGRQQSNLVDVA